MIKDGRFDSLEAVRRCIHDSFGVKKYEAEGMTINEIGGDWKMRSIAHFPIRICAEASQIPRIQIPLRDLYSCADAELEIRRAFLSVKTLRNGGKLS